MNKWNESQMHFDAVNMTWNGGAGQNGSHTKTNYNHTCE